VDQEFGVWTLIVAIPVVVVTRIAIAFRLPSYSGLYSVALAVESVKCAIEPREVAKLAGPALPAGRSKISTNVCASGGCEV